MPLRATLLGHATFVVQGGDATLLMDPVFFDPFEINAICVPKRVVHPEKIPRPDAIFISHCHLDHFDERTLQTLPRSTPIYLPPDHELREKLMQLQFYKVFITKPFQAVKVKGLTVFATPSKDDFEVGWLVSDGEASWWNHVDTVVSQRTCVKVIETLGRGPEVAVAGYNPLLEYAEIWVSEEEFPKARYERQIEVALCTRARTIVPGSAGQRIEGVRAWVNHRTFPVDRETFVKNLRDIEPTQHALIINPGDTLVMERGREAHLEASGFATMIEDDYATIRFAPREFPPPPFEDRNERGIDPAVLELFVEEMVGKLMPAKMREAQTDTLVGPMRTLWDRRAVLQVEVALPGRVRTWHLATWTPKLEWRPGAHPSPDYLFQYTASDLLAYCRGDGSRLDCLRSSVVRRPPAAGGPYRLEPLDPGRLHNVDLYTTMDEEYLWNPLILLVLG